MGITVGLMVGLVAYAATTTGAQQPVPSPLLTCSPTTVPAVGPSVEVTCSIENFPPNTPVTVTETFEPNPRQLMSDGAGRVSFTFRIPEFGVCAPLSELTISASGGGAQVTRVIAVSLVAGLPAVCDVVAVPAQPRLTG
jgi:hypothetical protein